MPCESVHANLSISSIPTTVPIVRCFEISISDSRAEGNIHTDSQRCALLLIWMILKEIKKQLQFSIVQIFLLILISFIVINRIGDWCHCPRTVGY